MTHEETSLQTKKALCASLKEFMKHKAFSKITVSEIVRDCNMNRKTFYYHFEDIYGLLKWMLEQETFEVIKQFDITNDYEEVFHFVIDYVENNAFVLNCMYDSVGRDELKRFFYKDFIGVTERVIRDTERSTGKHLSSDFRNFLCSFYTEAIANMLINLFQHTEAVDYEAALKYVGIILKYALPASLTEEL